MNIDGEGGRVTGDKQRLEELRTRGKTKEEGKKVLLKCKNRNTEGGKAR